MQLTSNRGMKDSQSTIDKVQASKDQPLPKIAKAPEVDYDSDGEDDPMASFEPLDRKLSYSITDAPPALEIMCTADIPAVRVRMKHSLNGIPFDEKLNSNHVIRTGTKVTRKHAQYALSAGMMLGIRECVGGVDGLYEAELGVDENPAALSEEDLLAECQRSRKYEFPPNLTFEEGGKPLPYSYEFKAYAPVVFSRIRSAFGIEKNLFLHSICGNFKFIEFMSNAKSGSFFFFSHDGRYMIKTMTPEETHFLSYILPQYYSYLMKNPHSFLTHFYGMYRVKIPETSQQVHFCIMKSVFNTEEKIHKIWDLKGSTKGRKAKRGESVQKDLDIIAEGRKICVGPEKKRTIMSQLRSDATIMARLGVMDYSLLLGVHNTDEEKNKTHKTTKMRSNTPLRRQRLSDESEDEVAGAIPYSMDTTNMSDTGRDDYRSNLTRGGGSSTGESPRRTRAASDLSTNERGDESMLGEFLLNAPKPRITPRDDNGIESVFKKEIYFCGVIDILQHYNARKWGETVVRKAAGNAASEISCVDPETYANRFVKFISTLLE